MPARREPHPKKVLLTFVGFHDPFHASAVEGEELKGPILHLLGVSPQAVGKFQKAAGRADGKQSP
jgi:hypothetical protein